MGQLFPRSANLLARLSVYGIFVVAALGLIGLLIYSRSPYPAFAHHSPEQPVPFSHALHIGLKIDCRYCHTSVATSSFAGFPPTQTCMTCHSVIRTDSQNLAPVRESYQTGKPITWNRVNQPSTNGWIRRSSTHRRPATMARSANWSIRSAASACCSRCSSRIATAATV